jgi:hypothetical protein
LNFHEIIFNIPIRFEELVEVFLAHMHDEHA